MTTSAVRSRGLFTGFLVAIAVSAALSACGRKGELEVPGAAASPETRPTITGGFSAPPEDDRPEPEVPERRFVLDALI